MFALTSGGSAYRRRQHQYLHPARVYAPAKQENPASEKAAARAAGVSVLSVAGTACLMVGQCLRILLGEAAPGLGRLYHLDSGLPELESFAW